jgi:signal transduction histidine kinase
VTADAPNQANRAESEREVAQAFLLRLSDTIRPLADATAIKEAAALLLGTHLAADNALYFDVERESDGRYPLRACGESFVTTLTQGQTVVVPDITRHVPEAERAAHVAAGVQSLIIVPLLKGRQYVAGLAVVSGTPRRWTAEEIALAQETAERTWASVERARAETALHQAHTELERRVEERTAQLATANRALQTEIHERKAGEAQIKALLSRLVAVQEEERSRIARDIHDQLGQQMTALRMHVEALQLKTQTPPLAEQAERTQRLVEALDQSIDFLTWQLRPAALDHLGLSAALQHLVTGWSERFGVATEFQVAGDDGVRLSRDVEANLYRIVQEALHNVSRHAQATHVSVMLERRDGGTLIVIEDNGSGFDRSTTPAGHDHGLGLASMRERATLAGGGLDIESSPGHGTAIFVRIPGGPLPAE